MCPAILTIPAIIWKSSPAIISIVAIVAIVTIVNDHMETKLKNHLKNRSKDKTGIVCDTVKKCNECSRIITGKYVNSHKCGFSESNNCNKYIGKNHKCFMEKIKAKDGDCMAGNKEPCKNND